MTLTLYSHPLSSYCHKVLVALYENGTPFETELVNLGDPDARAAYAALWPTAKIPLLRDGERVVPETSVMIEYLDERHPGHAQLLPQDPEQRLDARLWDRVFDNYVMTPMSKIVAEEMRPPAERDPQAVPAARATLKMAYAMIEQRLAGRTWAAGEAFSIADCAAAPALFYAAIVEPIPQDHPNLSAYYERLMARPSFKRCLDEAQPWFDYYPFKHAIPARFLQPA